MPPYRLFAMQSEAHQKEDGGMDSLVHDFTSGLFDSPEAPCLSLYQPTCRLGPQKQGDRIRYRNRVKSLEESLLQKYPHRAVEPLFEPFRRLADDEVFWIHPRDGLAVLC